MIEYTSHLLPSIIDEDSKKSSFCDAGHINRDDDSLVMEVIGTSE